MSLIKKILQHEVFKNEPPVLVDIGSSGELNKDWKKIAKYSICIAFDADDRDIGYLEKKDSDYKKLFVYNAIVTEKKDNKKEKFYLTKSPHCSSLLKPDKEGLQDWIFADIFEVVKNIDLNTIDLLSVLKELNIKKIGWFKSDSQGIDLRLFKSLKDRNQQKVILADFEPGILNAYIGEDKLSTLMEYMNSKPFWVCDMNIFRTKRFNNLVLKKQISKRKNKKLKKVVKDAPGWAEISYFNDFNNISIFSKRDILLGIVLALLKEQYAFAIELTIIGYDRFKDGFFIYIREKILKESIRWKRLKKIFKEFIPPVFNKIFIFFKKRIKRWFLKDRIKK